jgi:hypothetical protein
VRPVPAQMLRYMFEQQPFAIESVRFSAPIDSVDTPPVFDVAGDFPQQATQYQDYAVIARRR